MENLKIIDGIKDWQIAQLMFGKNTKRECRIVKHLRKHGVAQPHCENWSIIYDQTIEDDCGWLIPNEFLK